MQETTYQLPPGYRGGKASFVTYDTNLHFFLLIHLYFV